MEPWVIEAALARLGERRLNLAEQTEVLRSTSKPGTVSWPDWWEIRNHADARPHIRVERRSRKARHYDPTGDIHHRIRETRI